jgi:CubicO group peptidase (beta-lactamase class C family)
MKAENLTFRLVQLAPVLMLLLGPLESPAQRGESFTVKGKTISVAAFDQEIARMIDDIGIPAMTIAVMDRGQVVFSKAYGYKNVAKKQKVNDQTLFEACSLSKSFLVFVAHQLVDEGKLDLDKPLCQYLPNERLAYNDQYKLITARMVLSHTSGTENWQYENNPDQLDILSTPGKKFVYSGEGYNYLADVIAAILHEPFEAYVEKRVLKPLHLKRTYARFKPKSLNPFRQGAPGNYALGYGLFDEAYEKHKNYEPVPSTYFNVVAKDYAKLIVSTFNQAYLSGQRVREILTPLVIENEKDSSVFVGPGFALNYCNQDTIMTQWGVNLGFRAQLMYSVVSQSGFAYFTNSDRGWRVTAKVNELLTNFDCTLFNRNYSDFGTYYPSQTIGLMKVNRKENLEAMFAEIERLKRAGVLEENTLNELASEFSGKRDDVSVRLLRENIALYPQSPNGYALLGLILMDQYDHQSAYENFVAAKSLHFKKWDIESDLESSRVEGARRQALCARYQPLDENNPVTIQAEDFCTVYGIQTEDSRDEGGGQSIGWVDPGDWMEYKVNVPAAGDYRLTYRVASEYSTGQVQLRLGPDVLATTDIPNTDGWQAWTTVTTTVGLPAGNHVVRLYASGRAFNLNWMQFRKVKGSNGQLVDK